MIYAVRKSTYRETLIELSSRKQLVENLKYISPREARRWVKYGHEHETGLFVNIDGKVRYAEAEE